MQMIDSMCPPTGISQAHPVSGLVDYHQLMHGLTAQPFHPAGSMKATGVKMSAYEHYIEPKSLKHTKTVVNRRWEEIFEHADGATLDRNASVGGLPITHKIVDQIHSPKRAFLSSARHKMQVGWGRGGGSHNGKQTAMRPAVEGRMSRSVEGAILRRKTTLALQEQAMAGIACAA